MLESHVKNGQHWSQVSRKLVTHNVNRETWNEKEKNILLHHIADWHGIKYEHLGPVWGFKGWDQVDKGDEIEGVCPEIRALFYGGQSLALAGT